MATILKFEDDIPATMITATAAVVYQNTTDKTKTVRYISPHISHINVKGEATTDNALIPAFCETFISVDKGKGISAVRAVGENDGPVYITTVSRV